MFLQARGSKDEKKALIDAIAGWLVDVGVATRAAPEALQTERVRLRDEVLPLWRDHELGDLLGSAGFPPAVLQHNDPGSWNIIVDGDRFTAVDWESAKQHGFPLWDVVYFLTDALVHLDGEEHPPPRRDRHTAKLWRGDAPSSPILFEWVRRAAESLEIEPEHVGPIVTLGWLHHGTSPARRADLGGRHGVVLVGDEPEAVAARAARLWMSEPGLGREWRAWHSRVGP